MIIVSSRALFIEQTDRRTLAFTGLLDRAKNVLKKYRVSKKRLTRLGVQKCQAQAGPTSSIALQAMLTQPRVF